MSKCLKCYLHKCFHTFSSYTINKCYNKINIKHFSILETHWFLFVTPRLKCFIFDKVFACFDFQVFDADKFLFALPSLQEADLVISGPAENWSYLSHWELRIENWSLL